MNWWRRGRWGVNAYLVELRDPEGMRFERVDMEWVGWWPPKSPARGVLPWAERAHALTGDASGEDRLALVTGFVEECGPLDTPPAFIGTQPPAVLPTGTFVHAEPTFLALERFGALSAAVRGLSTPEARDALRAEIVEGLNIELNRVAVEHVGSAGPGLVVPPSIRVRLEQTNEGTRFAADPVTLRGFVWLALLDRVEYRNATCPLCGNAIPYERRPGRPRRICIGCATDAGYKRFERQQAWLRLVNQQALDAQLYGESQKKG